MNRVVGLRSIKEMLLVGSALLLIAGSLVSFSGAPSPTEEGPRERPPFTAIAAVRG